MDVGSTVKDSDAAAAAVKGNSPATSMFRLDADSGVQEGTKQYSLPVDAEDKACKVVLLSLQRPHMRAFHLSWLCFFAAFISTFAPAGLLPVIRDGLDLTNTDLGNAGVASVCGAILARIVMGVFVDMFGPRLGAAAAMLGTAPAVFAIALVQDAAGGRYCWQHNICETC